MTTTTASAGRTFTIPSIVHRLDPIVRAALRLGVPMGPNILLTVRGRRSGEARTVPVAILRTEAGEFLFSPFGEVAWVQNLRAAGHAELRHGRRRRSVDAVEMRPSDAATQLEAGMRDVLRAPLFGPMIAGWYGITAASTSADYLVAAGLHPGFALSDRVTAA